ncbi:MAG TPA: FtsQ-type POTRA domain-containing protein [Actinobacteria bacterium]|nr:FtsQ-type POTRA domain-containing protein [Actinomycetota bacterium]
MNKEIATEKAVLRRAKIQKLKRRRRLGMVIFLSLIILIIFGIISLYNSDLFNVKKIIVTGNNRISKGQIIKESGIDSDTSLLKLSRDEIKKRILKEPWIKDVEIKRHFFNSVEIKLIEREAVAAVPFQDIYLLVDEGLIVLESREAIDELSLPVILDLKLTKAKIGRKLTLSSLKNAVKSLVSLDKELRDSVTMINAPSVEKLTLMLALENDNGDPYDVEILYGEANDTSTKNAIIKEILTKSKKHVIYIDVRIASNPAVKFLEDAS